MTGFTKFLDRYFIFLMGCLAASVLLFFYTEKHDVQPFITVATFGIPSWAALNISERIFLDRLKLQQNGGNGP